MVLQKRLDYGFNGYQVPAIPRATRSVRKRRSIGKKVDDNKMFAFNLLATVAGKLLLEGEISPTLSNNSVKDNCSKHTPKKEEDDDDKPMKVEPCDRGSCERNFFSSELGSQAHDQNSNLNEFPLASAMTNSDYSEKVGLAGKLDMDNRKDKARNIVNKIEVGGESYDPKLVDETKTSIKVEPPRSGNVLMGNGSEMLRLEDPPEVHDRKLPVLVSSDSSVKVPLCRDHHIPHGSFSPCRNDVNVVSRDDDENSSGCTQPSSTTTKAFRAPPHIADRRIRKFLASKYWKVAPKLKDEELSNTVGELKHAYRVRKNGYKRQRSQRNYPFKKRKFFHRTSVSNSDGGINSGGISNPSKGINGDASNLGPTIRGATRISSSIGGQHTSFQSRDSHVKLRIKSFRVPELFIEIPETATVGSLKRHVMEAVTAILGGGLRIGVLLQGKKVRDDTKTLLQTGIAHNNPLDSLGFTLEPNPSQSPALHPEDSSFLLPCDSPQPLTRYPQSSDLVQGSSDGSPDVPMPNLSNLIESDHDSAPSPTDISIDKGATESKAIIAIPAMSMEALTVVSLHRKPKQSDMVQRRIRRPFSVSEVEALVQAVEKLGTGRWRDVKLRAFDNAKHRTYVDLKDKWKTLVHTARISPQQRRGEPVPQELLDRVLAAHAYWSHQQAKQQLKPSPETFLLL